MSRFRRFTALVLLFACTIIVYLCFEESALFPSYSLSLLEDNTVITFSVNSENSDGVTCKFPDFDPFHPMAMKYYEKFPTTKCKGMTTLSYYDGEYAKINQTLKRLRHGNREVKCWYRDVVYHREMSFVNGEWHGPFTESLKVERKPEFIEVECTKGGSIVSKMHHYVTRKEYRKNSKPTRKDVFSDNQMNVILVGVDSLAKFLYKRAMPKTRQYLLEKLGAIEMEKYNKIGDNTFPNLLAILVGIYQQEAKNWSMIQGFDALPFVWNQYKAAGYRTQYTSDRVDFNDFERQPTDSYSLPMVTALMQEKISFDNDCYEDNVEVKLWLDHIIEFARDSLFTTGRFFSMAMIKRPTHDFPNKASAVDEHYANFLQELHESNLLNNTFLVFFGDHGPRTSDYRRTFLGSIEERAANMVIYLPPWFKKKYPMHLKNLKINQDRLTTNFDLYATLNTLLSLNDESYKLEVEPSEKTSNRRLPRGINLFQEIPPDRTCEDADIDAHNCLCHGGVLVNDRGMMQEVGNHVVNDINDLLSPVSSLCLKLRLGNVTSLSLLQGYVRWTATYRVMLSTLPGGAEFEATVQYDLKAFVFKSLRTLSYISRINMYRGQSECVDSDKKLRMYCYCKNIAQTTV